MDIETNSNNLTLVAALEDLCAKLVKEIVTEGVESNLQSVILQRLDEDYAQGYYFDKPLTAATFEE